MELGRGLQGAKDSEKRKKKDMTFDHFCHVMCLLQKIDEIFSVWFQF